MNNFESAVYARLKAYPPETVFIASVSGGADSAAMLAALASLRNEKCFSEKTALRCIHVEHGIRPPEESRGDANAVRALCKNLRVPCKVVFIPQGKIAETASRHRLGIEAAARFYRQKIWNGELCRIRRGFILTAHTRDDLLETMLMRFLKGAGPAGLASMRSEAGRIIRPLLEQERGCVISYLKEKGLSFCTDSTNSDTRYLRNRIRHKLIPLLDGEFPFWRSALAFSGETQRLASSFLSSEAEKRLPWEEKGAALQIPLEAFVKAPGILQEESFFQAADRLIPQSSGPPPRSLRRKSLRQFLAGLESASAADLGPVRAEKKGSCLILKNAPRSASSGGFSLLIKESGSYTLKNKFKIMAAPYEGAPVPDDGEFFFAWLPLVLRGDSGTLGEGNTFRFSDMLKKAGNYKEKAIAKVIAAEDSFGIAALIADEKKPFLLYRRLLPAQKEKVYLVELRGTDV